MEDHVYPSQINLSSSSSSERDKDLVRLEVFDHDYVSQNDFLGHIELSRDKLSALAVITAGQAIDVPLTMKEHRGVVGLKIGFDEEQGGLLSLQVCGAEGLDSVNPKDLSNPVITNRHSLLLLFLCVYCIVIVCEDLDDNNNNESDRERGVDRDNNN